MKKLLLALVLLMGVFGLAACRTTDDNGGDTPPPSNGQNGDVTPDPDPDPDPHEPDDYVQGITDTTIIVGNTAATEGVFAPVGIPFNAAIQAYFDKVNAEGGIGGRTIQFIHYNDDFNAATGRANTERLVEEDQVFALVGHFGTPTVGATFDYLNELGVPRVYYATGISALFNPQARGFERSSFPVQPIFDAEGEVMVARAVEQYEASRIGVIYSSADDGQGILNGVRLRAGILDIPLVEYSVEPDGDMSAAAQAIVNANVDVVIVAANQAPFIAITKALDEANNTKPVFTSYVSANDSQIIELEDVVLQGKFPIYANAWVNIFDEDGGFVPGYLEFAATVPEYAANAFAMAGYIAAHFFVEGLRRVGDGELTWESFINAMESAPIENPMGGIVDFANGRRTGTQAMSLLVATITDTEDGRSYVWEIVEPIQDINEILGE